MTPRWRIVWVRPLEAGIPSEPLAGAKLRRYAANLVASGMTPEYGVRMRRMFTTYPGQATWIIELVKSAPDDEA